MKTPDSAHCSNTYFFHKQLHFRPSQPQIFENGRNLANKQPSSLNRKFLATFEPQIGNFA